MPAGFPGQRSSQCWANPVSATTIPRPLSPEQSILVVDSRIRVFRPSLGGPLTIGAWVVSRNTYSALNALAGHFNSFGVEAPLPKKRLERVQKVICPSR
jgi:hypothetical protein